MMGEVNALFFNYERGVQILEVPRIMSATLREGMFTVDYNPETLERALTRNSTPEQLAELIEDGIAYKIREIPEEFLRDFSNFVWRGERKKARLKAREIFDFVFEELIFHGDLEEGYELGIEDRDGEWWRDGGKNPY